ncbi:hypothetical protein U0358_06500 [Idiomarina sp. PL1-037]|uniref:hypothetical protein n=1 Tax=Idiomarina sp. PL1-037 TaxID=3095365 RepID=UPI002ACC0D61|nr:hypothetical protein [Idiomarina sp. PL1-037]WQC54200.1 hypothetical protein U0358_06500 [Idiomarina sp. PL1-037]
MSKNTPKKPPFLNSEKAQQIFNQAVPEYYQATNTIDRMSKAYDSLSKLHSTPDPELSRSAHALKVKREAERALATLKKSVLTSFDRLSSRREGVYREAYKAAGYFEPLPESALVEVRSRLASLSQKQREGEIKSAFERGDMYIIRAVNEAASPFLVGTHTLPLESMVEQHIRSVSPDLDEKIAEIDDLTKRLDFAADGFVDSVKQMRDPRAESEADEQRSITDDATNGLNDALSGLDAVSE